MKRFKFGLVVVAALGLLAACGGPEEGLDSSEDALHGHSNGRRGLARVRRATARYHRVSNAQADGYDLIPGLDHCFTNQPVGDMGIHYIDASRLDTTVELTRPEAMVYEPKNGRLRLGAVEWIVPADAWDAEHPGELPSVNGQDFHLNAALGVYVLHAWVWKHNPSGIYEDWNPNVTCP